MAVERNFNNILDPISYHFIFLEYKYLFQDHRFFVIIPLLSQFHIFFNSFFKYKYKKIWYYLKVLVILVKLNYF